jgi:hypothetical protein
MVLQPEQPTEGTGATSSERPVEIYLEVSEVDAYHRQVALRASKSHPLDGPLGGSAHSRSEPIRYQIWFYQTIGEPIPPKAPGSFNN